MPQQPVTISDGTRIATMRQHRRARDLTQAALGAAMDPPMSSSALCLAETGRRPISRRAQRDLQIALAKISVVYPGRYDEPDPVKANTAPAAKVA